MNIFTICTELALRKNDFPLPAVESATKKIERMTRRKKNRKKKVSFAILLRPVIRHTALENITHNKRK
jgi:ribosome-associated translation inhibitor RaiA